MASMYFDPGAKWKRCPPDAGYGSRPVYTTGSPYGPAYTAPTQGSWNSANRDCDRDGIPNQYDRDANGDGVPDRYQGRP